MIDTYVNDIKRSLSNRLYYPALSLALTLPDICGSVEYPNKQISERYIGWYDRYIGDELRAEAEKTGNRAPYLSGEVVYNLRNTFLHSGLPGLDSKKIKDEENRINSFILFTGDSRGMNQFAVSFEDIPYKAIVVDVSYLCEVICEKALLYYSMNKDKFRFDYNVITEEDLFGAYSRLDNKNIKLSKLDIKDIESGDITIKYVRASMSENIE